MEEPVWIPRPDPALRARRPQGMRAHCYQPGLLHGWVFLQHEVWVDYWGNEHEIASMPLDYVANVIGFCELRADPIRLIAFAEAANRAFETAVRETEGARAILRSFADAVYRESDRFFAHESAVEWLRGTALLRALSDRLVRSES